MIDVYVPAVVSVVGNRTFYFFNPFTVCTGASDERRISDSYGKSGGGRWEETGLIFSGAYDFHSIPCRNRKYRRNRDSLSRQADRERLLDVGDGRNRRCFWHLSKVHWHRYIRQRMEKTSVAVLPTIWREGAWKTLDGSAFSVLLIICFAYGFNGLQSYNMSSALNIIFRDTVRAVIHDCRFDSGSRNRSDRFRRRASYRIYYVCNGADHGRCISSDRTFYDRDTSSAASGRTGNDLYQKHLMFRRLWAAWLEAQFVIGIKRGLFSNEAGMGSAPNAAASASVSHPAKQGDGTGNFCIYRHAF